MTGRKSNKAGKCRLCKLAVTPTELHPVDREPFVIGKLDDAGLCVDCQQLPSGLLFEWLVELAQGKKSNKAY